ncbi:MAG: hypothetical protein HYW25_04290 [Candidatus Aenigmarchaeota archaeon]|nr:hypothetical protein [Candidatus Aenigmarchaeota archaeon]
MDRGRVILGRTSPEDYQTGMGYWLRCPPRNPETSAKTGRALILQPLWYDTFDAMTEDWYFTENADALNLPDRRGWRKLLRRTYSLRTIISEIRELNPKFVRVSFDPPEKPRMPGHEFAFLNEIYFDMHAGRAVSSRASIPREHYRFFRWEEGFKPDGMFVRYKGVFVPEGARIVSDDGERKESGLHAPSEAMR